VDLMHAIVHANPAPLAEDIPVALRIAVEKALEKNPEDRYQNIRSWSSIAASGASGGAPPSSPAARGHGARASGVVLVGRSQRASEGGGCACALPRLAANRRRFC
jgi:hypothetical protein